MKDKYLKDVIEDVQPPPRSRAIGSENIGNKMLKAMGWNEGQGLGRSNQGMSNIIEAERRIGSAGLGLKVSTYNAGESYKDAVRRYLFDI